MVWALEVDLDDPRHSPNPAARLTQGIPAVVFARVPEPGKVKTRLASAVGAAETHQLAEAFLLDTWAGIERHGFFRPIIATTGQLGGLLAGLDTWIQGEGDLGSRLERMLRRALGGGTPALVLGADTPGLPRRLLEQARLALQSADAVLGPCDDGGFYLLGVHHCPEGLLSDLPWSESSTFERTKQRLLDRGLKVAVLDPWFDVDRPEDLERLKALIQDGTIEAPATERTLRSLGRLPRNGGHDQTISVIIPTLNEEARICERLRQVNSMPEIQEVIVVDGGSTDGTLDRVRACPNVRLLRAPRGRSLQMNQGADAATGDVLLFLHADVSLPSDAVDWIRKTLEDPQVVAGAFRTWTVADQQPIWIAPLLHLADLRSRYTSLPYGDQALFVRGDAFRGVGGFPEIALMEDLAICQRLRRQGKIRTVRKCVTVSGRRFLDRPLYYGVLLNLLPLLFHLGVPPSRLALFYGNPR